MYDLASKYFQVFKDFHIILLLMLMEEYVNGAELQIRRIERTRKLDRKTFQSPLGIQKINRTALKNRHLKIFCDAHFYFICIGQVSKCLERLCAELTNAKLKAVNSEFQKTFSREIRNDLEHIDARAVGKKKKGRKEVSIGDIRDFKNFFNDKLTFNGKAYPVNKESLKRLKNLYKKTILIIHTDYAVKDPYFVYNMSMDQDLKKVVKKAQKEYAKYLQAKQFDKD